MDYIGLSKEVSCILRHALWEYELEMDEKGLIDNSLPLEQQAFELRNQYRMQARELMSDQ